MPGTQYRFARPFVASYQKVQEGLIGRIISGYVYYHTGRDQFIVCRPEWSDMEYMIRGHFNWSCVNGDQISNMLIHWIDVFNWFSHLKPQKVIAYGSRIRKNIGNVYDNFSMHFDYEGGVTLGGMVRRIDQCDNGAGAVIHGEKGTWYSSDFSIRNHQGDIIWQYDKEEFFNNLKPLLSHASLKASYSLTADRGPSWVTNSLAVISSTSLWHPTGKETSLALSDLENSELTYEKKHELNIGAEVGFLGNRINLSFDWYQRNNFDLIGPATAMGIGGFVNKYANVAAMK